MRPASSERGAARWAAKRAPAGEIARRMLARWRVAVAAGLPAAPGTLERAGAYLAGAAVLWMAAAACWGINAPFGDGHFASTANVGVSGDNMWRNHVIYPLHYYVDKWPLNPSYYMHHPLGIYWVSAIFTKIFGAHNWAIRLPAILYSTGTPFFLYRFGRAVWGPLEGAVGALAFVALPITLGFAAFHALEVPVIFGLVVASWGFVRFVQGQRFVHAVASLVGFLWAVNHDWVGYVWGAAFLAWIFIRGFLLPGGARPGAAAVEVEGRTSLRVPGMDAKALGRYWGSMVAVALGSAVVMMGMLLKTGKLVELLGMYDVRSAGRGTPLSAVLQARHVWIELMFPALAILIGKLGALVVVGRVLVRRARADFEILPLFMLFAAVVQYVHFKQGADVHIFWPQYFAPYLAMAVGACVATLREALAFVAPRLRDAARGRRLAAAAPWVAGGVLALPLLFVLRDGAWMLRLAQESGGRFVSPLIRSDIDRMDALHWWLPRFPEHEPVGFHNSVSPVHWSYNWELRPRVLLPRQGVGDAKTKPRLLTLDTRFTPGPELQAAARIFHVEAVGPFWMIDRAAPPAPVSGYRLDEREPGPIEWYVHGGWEPMRAVRADPFVTWEWRSLAGQPVDRPTVKPETDDQVRVAHNAAVAAGDAVAAARFRAELERRFDVRRTATFDDGTVLLGAVHHRRAKRGLTLYFLAGPKERGRLRFAVNARVEQPPRLSTLAWDHEVIAVDQPPAVPTELWRAGHIYTVDFTYRKRPGTERLSGGWVSLDGKRAPAVKGGPANVDLLVL